MQNMRFLVVEGGFWPLETILDMLTKLSLSICQQLDTSE